jgi:hypothetical protein
MWTPSGSRTSGAASKLCVWQTSMPTEAWSPLQAEVSLTSNLENGARLADLMQRNSVGCWPGVEGLHPAASPTVAFMCCCFQCCCFIKQL